LSGECQGLPVGRKSGEHLESDIIGELAGHAAGSGDTVEVTRIRENDLVAVNRGNLKRRASCWEKANWNIERKTQERTSEVPFLNMMVPLEDERKSMLKDTASRSCGQDTQ